MTEFKIVKKEIGLLEFNFEEMKADLANQLLVFQDYKVTEENMVEAKATRANLNKIRDVIDNRRKELKKEYEVPLKEFEAKAKVLTQMIDDCSGKIDEQIKVFDESYKADKLKRIKEYFETLQAKVELSQIWDDKWFNKGETDKKVFDSIKEKLEKVDSALRILEEMETDPNALAILQAKYLTNLDVEKTITEYKREKQLAEVRKKELEEQQKQIEETVNVVDDIFEDVPTPMYEFNVVITASELDLKALSAFLKSKEIKYQKVSLKKIN